jgi:hypothetical protein
MKKIARLTVKYTFPKYSDQGIMQNKTKLNQLFFKLKWISGQRLFITEDRVVYHELTALFLSANIQKCGANDSYRSIMLFYQWQLSG